LGKVSVEYVPSNLRKPYGPEVVGGATERSRGRRRVQMSRIKRGVIAGVVAGVAVLGVVGAPATPAFADRVFCC